MADAQVPASLARRLLEEVRVRREESARNRSPIAIVGMACRFPGGENPATFWRQLAAGADAVTRGRPGETAVEPPWGSYVPDLDRFDEVFSDSAVVGFQLENDLELVRYGLRKVRDMGVTTFLDPAPATIVPPPDGRSTGRRSALAKWLTDPANPLVARVMVNRVWHHHFGRGIVATPSDLGTMGGRPTHPKLLDWLASEFVDSGWSVKHLHRTILRSSTYRQAAKSGTSEGSAARAEQVDPTNSLLWKFPARRLEAEVVRDAALSVAGLLNPTIGGPSVFPPLPEGVPNPTGGWNVTESAAEHRRRSVYVFVKRNTPLPFLASFDFPDTHESCGKRYRTTTAPQALSLLNGREPSEWARAFAGRVLGSAGSDPTRQVEMANRLAYGRAPSPRDKDVALTFLERQAQIVGDRPEAAEPASVPDTLPPDVSPQHAAALVDYCLMLLNSNEFVYSL